jgi:two-component sensor histidine kinase/PAS domain-containing protein
VANKSESLPAAVRASVTNAARRDALAALDVLDSEDDADFDRLAGLAASIFDAPFAVITLIDAERQWFKSRHGLQFRETPIEHSLSAHAIADRRHPCMIVPDAAADARFADNPLVTGEPGIRFYAGAPITVHGQRLGVLAVAAPVPRAGVERTQLDQLVALASTAASLFELKDEARVRARTAAELIKEEWRHALTLEAGKVGSWVWDIRTKDVVANDILRRMFGIDPIGPVSVDDIFDAINPADLPEVNAALDATFEDGIDYVSEFRVNSGRWLIGRGRVYQRDAAGQPLVMMGVNIDITDAREAADHTRHLLRELNHRVKNTLAMIQSLARQTLRRTPDPQRFIDAFSGRLRTLSDAHALLSDRDWSGIGLHELISSQVGPYVMASPDQVSIEGDDVQLPPDHALGLGLILHELSSNAVKFGALSAARGRVRISWIREGGSPQRIRLLWKESDGPQVAAPPEPGLGARLIQRSLDKILDSQVRLEFLPTGVEAEIAFPLG